MEKKNYYENVNFLKPIDEVKFVIGDYEDFLWSKNLIEKFELNKKCEILFSPVFGKIEYKQLVEWILNENLNVDFKFSSINIFGNQIKEAYENRKGIPMGNGSQITMPQR